MITHKRGDTFDWSGSLTLTDGGENIDLSTWIPKSQLRDHNKNLVADLECTWLDASVGLVRLYAPASETSNWPIGPLAIDIQITSMDGVVVSTPTQTIHLADDNTQ